MCTTQFTSLSCNLFTMLAKHRAVVATLGLTVMALHQKFCRQKTAVWPVWIERYYGNSKGQGYSSKSTVVSCVIGDLNVDILVFIYVRLKPSPREERDPLNTDTDSPSHPQARECQVLWPWRWPWNTVVVGGRTAGIRINCCKRKNKTSFSKHWCVKVQVCMVCHSS